MLSVFNRNILIWKLTQGGSPAGLLFSIRFFNIIVYSHVYEWFVFFFYGYINSHTLPTLSAKSLI